MKLIELLGSNPILKKKYFGVLRKQISKSRFVQFYIRHRVIPVVAICLAFLYFFMLDENAECEETNSPYIEVLALEDALSMALAENRRIENAVLEVDKAGDAVSAARTSLFPKFDVSLFESYHLTDEAVRIKEGQFGDFRSTGPIPPENVTINTTPNFTTFITASAAQPISQLYEFLLILKQRKVEKALFNQELRSKRQETTDKVKKGYYNILKSQSSIEEAEEKIVFLKELNILVDRYLEVERALESESLEVKARLAEVDYDAFSLKNTLATEKEQLNDLLGRDIETPFQVNPVPEASPLIVNEAEAQEEALSQRPDVLAAKLNLEFAENEVRIKKSKYIPEIGVQFSYIGNLNVEFFPENSVAIGIFAKWDIFDWGRKQDEIAEKRRSVLQAKNDITGIESSVRIDVNEKIRKLEETEVLIGVTRKDQAAKREKLREVMNKYKVDSALLQEVLEVEAALGEANNKYQQAVLDYWTARANLERAVGEE
ncbi:TolC family protein [Desulfobacterota bacterium AH_259_B03_O07]|nr:TolC family protein [Desulfobacterota bacterium AH_259_B03_O07]